jgi:hypothetical protein
MPEAPSATERVAFEPPMSVRRWLNLLVSAASPNKLLFNM